MSRIDFVDPFVNSPVGTAEELVFTDPRALAKKTKPPIAAGWKLLAGTVTLRRGGHTSEANDWLNTLTKLKVAGNNELLKAEMLAEAGQALYAEGETAKAIDILNSAVSSWEEVCDQALPALRGESTDGVAGLAPQIVGLAEAVDVRSAPRGKAATTLQQGPALVRQWLEERGVSRRADVVGTFVRALLKAGDADTARKVCNRAVEWTTVHFTTSRARSKPDWWRGILPSSAQSRLALYSLALAQGEVEQSEQDFQRSAAAFGGAAGLYEGNVVDHSDINRLLQAKANEANSLLRLGRYDEAIKIYELVEHGFHSLGDAKRAQRVAQAKLFAETKKMETHGS